MKNTKKISILFLLTCMMMVLTTGCSLFKFDASGYVQACLDANTHGEFAAYAEITNTPIETAEQQYNDRLDEEISYLDAYNLSDEKKAQFRELYIKMYNSFKYEVGEAIKNDDGSYSVPVATYKLKVFDGIMTEAETFMTDYTQKAIDANTTPTTEELFGAAADFMYDYISQNLESLEYEEGVTTTVTVAPTASDSRVYSLDQYELQSLLESMVDIENVQ